MRKRRKQELESALTDEKEMRFLSGPPQVGSAWRPCSPAAIVSPHQRVPATRSHLSESNSQLFPDRQGAEDRACQRLPG